MILKQYSIPNVNTDALNKAIADSATINVYQGFTFSNGILIVMGESFANEAGCDSIVAGHDPNSPSVPLSVTPRQLRVAIAQSGILLADIDAAIDTLEEPARTAAHIAWEYSISMDREDPLFDAMGALLNLTPAQVDAIFILAGSL